eukprot:10473051-Alexandrium_andersonii.AAC.1
MRRRECFSIRAPHSRHSTTRRVPATGGWPRIECCPGHGRASSSSTKRSHRSWAWVARTW